MGQHQESGRMGTLGNENLPEYDTARSTSRRENSVGGVFKNVSNELSGAYKHFNELWKEFEVQENLDEVFKDKHIEVAARKYGGSFDEDGHVEFETEKGKEDFIEYLASKDYPYFKKLNDAKHSEKNQGAFSFEEKVQSLSFPQSILNFLLTFRLTTARKKLIMQKII